MKTLEHFNVEFAVDLIDDGIIYYTVMFNMMILDVFHLIQHRVCQSCVRFFSLMKARRGRCDEVSWSVSGSVGVTC